jgi:glucan biosynthesis protein
MAEFNFVKPGLNAVGQYQLSGIPYATSTLAIDSATATELEFPTVTKFVTVVNEHSGSSAKLRVGFSAAGVAGNNYFILDNGESYTGEFRVSSIFLRGDTTATSASVIAGLTMIETNNLPTNWSGSDSIYTDGIG